MTYHNKACLTILLCCFTLMLPAVVVQIGFSHLTNRCLPMEPLMNYSYSQSLYMPAEIGSGGLISAIGFEYNIGSSIFLTNNNQVTIYLGSVQRDRYNSLTDWVPLDSLQLVFEGTLQQEWFSSALPGQGWLTIPLTTAYNFNGTANLVIAMDENTPGRSSTADDFYCSNNAYTVSIEVHSMTINPDPASPPAAYEGNPLSVRPNLRLEIEPVIYVPHSPEPMDWEQDVTLDTSLSWQSNATSWDLLWAEPNQAMQTVATGLTTQSWTPPLPLSLYSEYRWQVVSHFANVAYEGPIWVFTTVGETLTAPQNLQAMSIGMQVRLDWDAPVSGSIVSYRIYRNINYLSDTQDLQYYDTSVLPNQNYAYQIAAVNYLNQISPPSNIATISIPGSIPVFQISFDDQPDFALTIPGWTLSDLDHSLTWQWDGVNFPHEGSAMSWIVFNPFQTTPPITEVQAHNGQRMLLCMDSTSPPNNDWLISPRLTIHNGYELSYWARSYSGDFSLERLRCLISTTDAQITSFQPLSTEPWMSIPAQWTQYTHNLSTYAGQQVYLAWQCVSWDAFALCLDEIKIISTVGNEDELEAPKPQFIVYPNPAKDHFTIESKDNTPFEVNIYNTKGQLVHHAIAEKTYNCNESLTQGLYLIQLKRNNTSASRKLVVY